MSVHRFGEPGPAVRRCGRICGPGPPRSPCHLPVGSIVPEHARDVGHSGRGLACPWPPRLDQFPGRPARRQRLGGLPIGQVTSSYGRAECLALRRRRPTEARVAGRFPDGDRRQHGETSANCTRAGDHGVGGSPLPGAWVFSDRRTGWPDRATGHPKKTMSAQMQRTRSSRNRPSEHMSPGETPAKKSSNVRESE
jgi:hypothetical protein